MGREDVLKRMRQLYAQSIQYGFSEEEVLLFLNDSFEKFLKSKKDAFYNKK